MAPAFPMPLNTPSRCSTLRASTARARSGSIWHRRTLTTASARNDLSGTSSPADSMRQAAMPASFTFTRIASTMSAMDAKNRLDQIRALLAEDAAETTAAILDFFKEQYGGTGFL